MDTFAELVEELRGHGREIRTDSREVRPGDVFVALRGSTEDGAAFIPAALAAGAGVIVCEPRSSEAARRGNACVIVCEDTHTALCLLAQAAYRTDALPFPLIGVTGTNGKSTIVFLLEHLFTGGGKKSGILGTITYRWPGVTRPAPLTTPGNLDLHRMLDEMRDAGVDVAIMEVSSHAVDQDRIRGLSFAGAIFTNLTQDHLDYHRDMESYFSAKARLFSEFPDSGKVCVINEDDAWGRRLIAICPQAVAFGLEETKREKRLAGRILSSGRNGLHLRMRFQGVEWELRSPLVGTYNASNLLAAQALALGLGMTPDELRYLESFTGVPGRLERVENPQGLHVFVDYAHTPDALINVLRALRGAGFSRLITVFGCGGDRDRAKRPLMGQAVAEYSDVAVLTSDNPRTEEPETIMADVTPGLRKAKQVIQEVDRRKATHLALNMLGTEDALLIAGKGHEDYQIIGKTRHAYSDQQVARELLACV